MVYIVPHLRLYHCCFPFEFQPSVVTSLLYYLYIHSGTLAQQFSTLVLPIRLVISLSHSVLTSLAYKNKSQGALHAIYKQSHMVSVAVYHALFSPWTQALKRHITTCLHENNVGMEHDRKY